MEMGKDPKFLSKTSATGYLMMGSWRFPTGNTDLTKKQPLHASGAGQPSAGLSCVT